MRKRINTNLDRFVKTKMGFSTEVKYNHFQITIIILSSQTKLVKAEVNKSI